MKTVIIGLGAISETHIAAIQHGEFTTITAVCDLKQERVDAAIQKIGDANVKGYTDYTEMIDKEKPDVVHVCTP
ncbi:MAG: Gfo/Idh/MocA family oxidoreductase, partial [Clostridia bacterium]|nr:Gfo/Idh/MocA family oxidoreductase [Clostridia bacterium]